MEEFLEAKEPERYDLTYFMNVLCYAESEKQILEIAYENFLARSGVHSYR